MVDELGLEKVPLLALSQGCALAVAFAALHPERVSRLVLYGGYLQGRFRRPATQLERAQSEVMLQMLPLGWGYDNPAFRQFFATLFLPEGTPEQMAWFRDLQRVSTSAANAVRLWLASADIDVRDLAPMVQAPTLVLHAAGDAAGLVDAAIIDHDDLVGHRPVNVVERALQRARGVVGRQDDANFFPVDHDGRWSFARSLRLLTSANPRTRDRR